MPLMEQRQQQQRQGEHHDERCGRRLALGEDGQLDAELDRRTLHHPSELAASDDSDDGETPGGTLGLAHGLAHDAPA